MSNVAGYLTRANADTNDDVGEWQQHVLHRNAKGLNTGSTLFALMSRLRNENADSQTYNWWEKDPVRRVFYANATVSGTTATALQFSNATASGVWDTGSLDTSICALLKNGAILENQTTGERVTVVQSSSSFSTPVIVSRGSLGYNGSATTPTAITIYDAWVLVTLAKPNGANPIESAYTQPSRYLNYCQTFNATASVDNAYRNGILRTDINGPWLEAKSQALETIANDIELAYFFGVAGISGATYTTGGLRNAIDVAGLTANALAGLGTAGVTLDAFDTWMESFMAVGSDLKLAFCGPRAYSAISRYAGSAQGGYRIMQSDNNNAFGLNLTSIFTPHGVIELCAHPLFKTTAPYNGHMFVVDLELVCQKTMEPLFFEQYAPTNGSASLQGQFRAMLGLKQKYPAAFGYATNLQKINP